MYAVTAPGLKGIYEDSKVVDKAMTLYPYTKFGKSQTEEGCWAFLERYENNHGIEGIRSSGDALDKHHVMTEYFVRNPSVYFNYGISKLGILRLAKDTAIIGNRTSLIKTMIPNLIVDRESIGGNIIAVHNSIKLLGDFIDTEAAVPGHSIFYAIRSYAGNNRVTARLEDYLKVRLGKMSVTLRR